MPPGQSFAKPRLGPLIGAVLLALAAHLALWGLAERRDSSRQARAVPTGALVLVPARSNVAEKSASISTPPAAGTPVQREVPASAKEPLAPRSLNDRMPKGEAAYFRADAVDRAARPVIDWVLRPEALSPDRLFMLTFTVWVSADGRINHWSIQRQSPPGTWADELLADLQTTPMSPATLAGRAVPSETSIELALDNRVR